MIYTITLNVAIDKTTHLKRLEINELNRLDNIKKDAGGKGLNVSKGLNSLQCPSIALGICPIDGSEFIKQELDASNIKYDFILVDGSIRNNLKIIDENGQLTEINEKGPTVSLEDLDSFTSLLQKLLKPNDMLIMSGSVPEGISKDYYAKLVSLASDMNVNTIVDADGELLKNAIGAGPTIIKPNRYELIQYYNLDKNITNTELLEYAKKLINDKTKIVVLSLAADGAYFIKKDQVIKTAAMDVDLKSSVGAGDSMVAAIAFAFTNRLPFRYLAQLATASAAASISIDGTKAASLDDINKLINKVNYKIID